MVLVKVNLTVLWNKILKTQSLPSPPKKDRSFNTIVLSSRSFHLFWNFSSGSFKKCLILETQFLELNSQNLILKVIKDWESSFSQDCQLIFYQYCTCLKQWVVNASPKWYIIIIISIVMIRVDKTGTFNNTVPLKSKLPLPHSLLIRSHVKWITSCATGIA